MNLQAKTQGGSPARLPAHEVVYRALRDRILFGELAPGQAVTIQGLTSELQAGMTPVREAIRRLMAEGALEFMGNRRVVVPSLSAEDIDQLFLVRLAVEPELARRACARATTEDQAALAAIDDDLDRAISRGDVQGYLVENHRFHTYLNSIAQAPILSDLVAGLWLRFGPSLRVVTGRFGTQTLPDRHKELLQALIAQDADAAAAAMVGDVKQGMMFIRQALSAD